MKLLNGNNLELLKTLEDNSVDSVVTDPPYGLSFMNKKWDYNVPSVEFWKEVYRVLKPGGHILSFGGTRTYHRMVVNIEDAGFEIRDQIMWLYGSGFPKSHNIGKSVDKLEGNDIKLTKGTSPYEGWGTALKPANEPICVARKPLSEKSVAENVLKWGTGGINVDGSRVGYVDDNDKSSAKPQGKTLKHKGWDTEKWLEETKEPHNEGRFPANIIFDEEAAKLLDEQSGLVNQGHWSKGSTKGFGDFGGGSSSYEGVGKKDKTKSGASRFFYQSKVSKQERNMGLDGFEEKEKDRGNALKCGNCGLWILRASGDSCKCGDDRVELKGTSKNHHPTVKPINLMTYLCRLITPKGGTVLDPFMGSGSSGISACLEGFNFIGMEMDQDYFNIAEARINNYELYRKFLK